VGRSFFNEPASVLENGWHTQQNELRKLFRINQVNAGFFIARFAGSMGRLKPGARMSRTGQSEPLSLRPQAMSLDEARQVITCWLESIETMDPIDLTEERFNAAISSDERLNEALDIIAASAVEQFSTHVLHGRVKLARRLPMSTQFI
jgi:hypothetical protein